MTRQSEHAQQQLTAIAEYVDLSGAQRRHPSTRVQRRLQTLALKLFKRPAQPQLFAGADDVDTVSTQVS